jgi:hypothetical protein
MQMKYLTLLACIAISANSFACVDDNGVFYDLMMKEGQTCFTVIADSKKVVSWFSVETRRLSEQRRLLEEEQQRIKREIEAIDKQYYAISREWTDHVNAKIDEANARANKITGKGTRK